MCPVVFAHEGQIQETVTPFPIPCCQAEVCVSLPTLTQLTAKPPSCLLYLPETNQVMVRTLRWFHRWTGLGKAGVTEVNHLSLCLSVQWCLIPENTSLPPSPTLPSSITLSHLLFLISFLILGIFFFLNPFCCSLQKQCSLLNSPSFQPLAFLSSLQPLLNHDTLFCIWKTHPQSKKLLRSGHTTLNPLLSVVICQLPLTS